MTRDDPEYKACDAAARAMYFEHFAGRSVPYALNVLADLIRALIETHYSPEDRPAMMAMLVRSLEGKAEH